MSKIILIVVVSVLLALSFVTMKQIFIPHHSSTELKLKVATFTPTTTQAPTSISTKSILNLSKESYTIALYGDSMIDTMGEKLEILQIELYRSYPKTTFKLYNYGIGAQNIEEGVLRFASNFSNKERIYAPITNIDPDILILGTFAYNPFVPHDLEKYKKELMDLIQKAKNVSLKVYLLAEIAPQKTGFGQGEYGINWPQDQAYQQAVIIMDQIKEAIKVANREGIPVINAYQKSLLADGFGNPIYVRNEDGIHPSYEGHVLMAREIISKLSF